MPLHLILCLLASPASHQDPTPRHPDEIVAEPALLSVDTKHAARADVGLWRRETDGTTRRILECDPYDSLWLPDRTILVAERWKGKVSWIAPDGKVLFARSGLAEPVDVERASDGTIVVVERGKSRVIGLDPETGRILWQRTGFVSPFDAAPLRSGNLLVADSDGGRVVELDTEGKLVWEYRMVFPNTVEPLADGGVLISNWTRGDIIELGPDHRVRWKTHVGGTLYSAERLPEGLTVACDGGGKRVLFLDERGKLVKSEKFAPGCVDYETVLEL